MSPKEGDACLNSWSYSAESFTALSRKKAQRGRGLDPTTIDPKVEASFRELKDLRRRYFRLRAKLRNSPVRLEKAKIIYTDRREKLREIAKEAVNSAVTDAREAFENDIAAGIFSWGLKEARQFKKSGRPGEIRYTYSIPKDLKLRLPELEASEIIRAGTRQSPQNRDSLVRALQHALHRPYAHGIIKIDISRYFESISHALLLEKVRSIRGADSTTIHLVESLLTEFGELTGNHRGIPQGVGLSAHLAELYLSDFDHRIRTHTGVVYYARYVDDVIVVVDSHDSLVAVEKAMAGILEELELERNSAKDHKIFTADNGDHPAIIPSSRPLDYLGYQFEFRSNTLKTTLSENRVRLRLRRLSRAFEAWKKSDPDPTSPNFALDGLLLKRIRFLAGNARLDHSKSNVVVGIYFSNSALSEDASQLEDFDTAKNELVKLYETSMRPGFAKQLEAVSFVEGFKNRTFIRFREGEIEKVFSCWKDLK